MAGRPLCPASLSRVLAAAALAPILAIAAPGDTEPVSVRTGSDAWVSSSALHYSRAISADGRYVVFSSGRDELAAGGGNGASDVYLRDRVLETTERISVDANGQEGNDSSYDETISADGRYVVYQTRATNLSPGDGSRVADIIVHDRSTHTNTGIGVDPAGNAFEGGVAQPGVSADGRYVVFAGYGRPDANGLYPPPQVYLHDRTTGATELVSAAASAGAGNGRSESPQVSADGRWVVFTSAATDLVAGDTNGRDDVFLRDRTTGKTTRMSRSAAGYQAQGDSWYPQITPNGRYVVFASLAGNLVADDRNFASDIFVRDRETGQLERVSVNVLDVEANGDSWYPSISDDGRYVAFTSNAFNLDPADLNYFYDVFVKDRSTGHVERVNLAPDGHRFGGDEYPARSSIAGDGQFVAFDSYADTTLHGLSNVYVFVHELGVVTPPPQSYSLAPEAQDFGVQTVFTNRTRTFWLTNTSAQPLQIDAVTVRGNWASFFVAKSRCGASVAVGVRCRIDVVSRPTRTLSADAELVVAAGTTPIRRRALSGRGVIASFELAPTSIDFGTVAVGAAGRTRTVTVRNTGLDVLPIKSIYLDGGAASQYTLRFDCAAIVAHDATCRVQVTFRPTQAGAAPARLTVWGGGYAGPQRVQLTGTGG
ncbi:MAG TPA: choice-of-anchor D domain-containing protein [Steroidobacteraceae bacterium]|nr:choice-of-anchor D domain-containing protein [Steroidobacteraceae bacterium]